MPGRGVFGLHGPGDRFEVAGMERFRCPLTSAGAVDQIQRVGIQLTLADEPEAELPPGRHHPPGRARSVTGGVAGEGILEVRPVEVVDRQHLKGRNGLAFVVDGSLTLEKAGEMLGDHRQVASTSSHCIGGRLGGVAHRDPPVGEGAQRHRKPACIIDIIPIS